MLIISPKTRQRHALTRRGLLTGAAALSMIEGLKLSDAQAQSACGTLYRTAPTQAVNAGITTLFYTDDYNIAGTLAPNTTVTSGYNLYPSTGGGIGSNNSTATVTTGGATAANGTPIANCTVYTQATAAGLANKNTGGGSFASPNGGLLALIAPPYTNGGLFTATTTATSTQPGGAGSSACGSANIPAIGVIPIKKSFYVQALIQLNPGYVCTGQWSGLWGEPQERIIPPGQTGLGNLELDQFECAYTNGGYALGELTTGSHQWLVGDSNCNGASQFNSGGGSYNVSDCNNVGCGAGYTLDNNFHLFGYLMKNNGNGTGTVSLWMDNTQVYIYNQSVPLKTGTGGSPGYEWAASNWQEYWGYSACFPQVGTNQQGAFANSGASTTNLTPGMYVDYLDIFIGSS